MLNETKAAELRQLLRDTVYIPMVLQKAASVGLPIQSEADLVKFAETVAHLRQVRDAAVENNDPVVSQSRYDGLAGLAKQASDEYVGPQIDTSPLAYWLQKQAGGNLGSAAGDPAGVRGRLSGAADASSKSPEASGRGRPASKAGVPGGAIRVARDSKPPRGDGAVTAKSAGLLNLGVRGLKAVAGGGRRALESVGNTTARLASKGDKALRGSVTRQGDALWSRLMEAGSKLPENATTFQNIKAVLPHTPRAALLGGTAAAKAGLRQIAGAAARSPLAAGATVLGAGGLGAGGLAYGLTRGGAPEEEKSAGVKR